MELKEIKICVDAESAKIYESAIIADRQKLDALVSLSLKEFDSKPSSDNWLEGIIGSISDDAAFLEALEYGRAFRQSDKPLDDTGK